MKHSRNTNIFSLSALVAFSLVVVICLGFLLLGYSDPIDDILSNRTTGSSDHRLYSILPLYFFLDTVFVLCWLVSWFGTLHLIKRGKTALVLGIFFFGLLGPFLDFSETILSLYLVVRFLNDRTGFSGLYNFWLELRELSFVLPVVVAVLFGCLIFEKGVLGLVTSLTSLSGIVFFILGRCVPSLWFLTYLWWPLWFLVLSLYFRRKAPPVGAA